MLTSWEVKRKNRPAHLLCRLSMALWLAIFGLLYIETTLSAAPPADSALTGQQLSQVEKLKHLAKSGNAKKIDQVTDDLVNSAQDVSQCLEMASATANSGSALAQARTKLLSKAITLSKSSDDFLRVATKARQIQSYDMTAEAVKQLIGTATTTTDLYTVAAKAQQMALNDVAKMALEKIYAKTQTMPEAVELARQSRLLGIDDLGRKILKALIDDQRTTHELCTLLNQVEPFEYTDVNRYLLRRSLDTAVTIDDYHEVFNCAKHLHQSDIYNIALFRARRLKLIDEIKQEHDLDAQQKKAAEEAQQQKAADDAQKHPEVGKGPGF